MIVDRYTKVVLTVIAAALAASVIQNFVNSVNASDEIKKVIICGENDSGSMICAGVVGQSYHPVQNRGFVKTVTSP